MTLDELKAIVTAVKEYEWCGRKIHLRKLGAKDHIALFCGVKKDSGEELNPEQDHQATLGYHIEIAARSLASPDGNLIADSDEGRKWLEGLPFDELVQLGTLILAHTGYQIGDEKKSLPTSNCSPSDSAAG